MPWTGYTSGPHLTVTPIDRQGCRNEAQKEAQEAQGETEAREGRTGDNQLSRRCLRTTRT